MQRHAPFRHRRFSAQPGRSRAAFGAFRRVAALATGLAAPLRALPPRRRVSALAVLVLLALAAAEPARPGPTRPDPAASRLEAGFWGRSLALDLALDRAVPFRVFTLDDPRRLVLDLEGVDWTGFDPAALGAPGGVAGIRVGPIRPGWGRLVLDLARPLALDSAEMRPGPGGARLAIRLARVSPGRFEALSGPPPGDAMPATWPAPSGLAGDGPVTVAIDPGHGGVDPGAIHAGVAEKDVVLAFAVRLADTLAATGRYRVLLTRTGDDFLSLDERVARARAEGADLLLSLHTNAAADPAVHGAIAFTLASAASSREAAARAALENRADTRAGLAAAPSDPVEAALADLARARTGPRARVLSAALARALAALPGGVNAHPDQAADFAVLRSPEIPSVLLELGFLSNEADRARMQDADWIEAAAEAIREALDAWSG